MTTDRQSDLEPPTDLTVRRAAKERERKAKDDGTCPVCGRYRVACSPEGRACLYGEQEHP